VNLANLSVRDHDDDLMGGFRLCDTSLQKLAMGFALLTTPTIGDLESLSLPRELWWSYRLTRPLRLIWRRLSGGTLP